MTKIDMPSSYDKARWAHLATEEHQQRRARRKFWFLIGACTILVVLSHLLFGGTYGQVPRSDSFPLPDGDLYRGLGH